MLIHENKSSQNQQNFLMLKRINLYELIYRFLVFQKHNSCPLHSFVFVNMFKALRIISKPRMVYLEILALKSAKI